ncbi:MFS transporter [Streptomyces sp. NPDC005077]|uniref:MFS transporter n=1 Tax=Streptomyces sp. NPDC005077 TaxID=3154292 RepID=UPI0033B6964E
MTEATQQAPEAVNSLTESGGGFTGAKGWTAAIIASFLGMILVQEYVAISYTTVSIALPDITKHFATTQGGWLLTGYILTGAVMSPLLGRMADIYGKRRILLIVLGGAGLGGVIAALAPNMGILILGRCLEGLSIAGLFLSYSLMRDIFPKRILPLAISLCVTGSGIFGAFIPLLVGALLGKFGFRGLFWVDVIVIGLLFLVVRVTTPETPLRKHATLDVLGGLLLGGGTALVLIAISQGQTWGWGSAGVVGFIIGGMVVLAAFYVWTRSHRDPVVDLRMFTRRPIAMAAVTSALAYGAFTLSSALYPLISLSPTGHGYGLGMTPTSYAAVATPLSLAVTLGGFLVGRHVARIGGRRLMIIGCGLLVVAGLLLTFFNDTYLELLISSIIAGLGTGMTTAAVPNLVVDYAPTDDQGSIAGNVQIATSAFSSIAPVAMFAILASTATVTPKAVVYAESGFQGVSILMAAFASIALILLFTVFSARSLNTVRVEPSQVTVNP